MPTQQHDVPGKEISPTKLESPQQEQAWCVEGTRPAGHGGTRQGWIRGGVVTAVVQDEVNEVGRATSWETFSTGATEEF